MRKNRRAALPQVTESVDAGRDQTVSEQSVRKREPTIGSGPWRCGKKRHGQMSHPYRQQVGECMCDVHQEIGTGLK